MTRNESSESERVPKGNVFREADTNAEGDSNRLKPTPEVPPKNSPTMRFFKKLGYSVWLIVMVVGGALAFITFLFLI